MASVDGRDGIVLEKLDGPDLLTELGGKPRRLLSIAGICGRLQARINACVARRKIESLHGRFRRIISHNNLIPGEIKTAALSHLDGLPEGDRLLHGDFHPGNVMWKNGEPAVIDWSNVTRGPAEADYFRTYLMATLGSLPPGTPLVLRILTPFARRIFCDSNARAYKRVAKPDPDTIKVWRLPVVAARIGEGIEDEREALMQFIEPLLREA